MLTAHQAVFSPARSFNDPFECRPSVITDADRKAYNRRVIGVLDELARIQYQQQNPRPDDSIDTYSAQFIRMHYNTTTMELRSDTPLRDEILHIVESDTNDNIGILSLSAVPDNQLMWSHYAVGHRGFVVGFDDQHDWFHLPSVLGGGPLEVFYSRQRLSWTEATARPESWYLTKSEDWRYEHEWRVLRRLAEATGPVDPLDEFGHFGPGPSYFDFPSAAVKEIIFGARMIQEERAEFIEDLRATELYEHVDLLQASASSREFRMVLEKL